MGGRGWGGGNGCRKGLVKKVPPPPEGRGGRGVGTRKPESIAPRLSYVAKLATQRPVTYFKHRRFSSPSQWGNARVLVVGLGPTRAFAQRRDRSPRLPVSPHQHAAANPGNPEGHDAGPHTYRLLVAIRCEENLSRNVSNERGKNHLHARFIRRLKPRLGQIREPLRAHAFAERAFQRDRKSTRSELQSRLHLVCRLLLEKKKKKQQYQ